MRQHHPSFGHFSTVFGLLRDLLWALSHFTNLIDDGKLQLDSWPDFGGKSLVCISWRSQKNELKSLKTCKMVHLRNWGALVQFHEITNGNRKRFGWSCQEFRQRISHISADFVNFLTIQKIPKDLRCTKRRREGVTKKFHRGSSSLLYAYFRLDKCPLSHFYSWYGWQWSNLAVIFHLI